jgi:hypothetical protein
MFSFRKDEYERPDYNVRYERTNEVRYVRAGEQFLDNEHRLRKYERRVKFVDENGREQEVVYEKWLQEE